MKYTPSLTQFLFVTSKNRSVGLAVIRAYYHITLRMSK